MTAKNRTLRNTLLIGASIGSMMVAVTAHAQSRPFARAAADPATAAARAAQSAATRNAAAQAAAQRTRAALSRAAQVRSQMNAAQAAARAAAAAAQSSIANGLAPGGLQVANGAQVDPSLWIGAKGPTQSQTADGRTAVTIDQTQEKAILTWDSFNVGRETDLTFNQQGNANWIALNRVTDASADPTQILGSIKADGSVYILNRNGVIFGGTAQINVRNLVASTLEIHGGNVEINRPRENNVLVSDLRWEELKAEARNQKFMDGLFGANKQDSFGDYRGQMTFWDGVTTGLTNAELTAERENAAQSTAPGVTVAAGARIETADSGTVMLVGRNVDNSGVISAPSGQVLLAAGRGVTMIDGTSRVLGGYAVPGDSRTDANLFKIPGYIAVVQQGGRTSNDGLLESTRGNVSMVGSAVVQDGMIAATTGVDKAGSIILDASSAAGLSGFNPILRGDAVGGGSGNIWRGTVTIGEGSHMAILPDDSGQTAPGSAFTPSDVEIVGNQIIFEQGSVLWAPGATLYLSADGLNTSSSANPRPGRIYLDRGAVLDVSGLNGVEIDMAQNSIKAELRANELADNPVMRDGDLRGETIWFDGRLGEKLTDGSGVGDLSGWYDLIQRDVDQFLTTGGSITMKGAEIITRDGSTIDLSGGSVRYNDGLVRRTRLIDVHGRLVPIEEAVAGVKYVGIEGDFVVNHSRWGVTERFENAFARVSEGSWQKGYVEGRSAGSLTIHASRSGGTIGEFEYTGDLARIFEGEVKAGVIVGENQREAPTGAGVTDVAHIWRERPALATLTMGETYVLGNSAYLKGGDVVIADQASRLGDEFTAGIALFDAGAGYASLVDGVATGRHVLSSDWFDGETFGHVTIHSGDSVTGLYTQANGGWTLKPNAPTEATGGVLTIGAGVTVDLGDYGSFDFVGRQANIDGTIRAAGGSVSLEGTWLPKAGTTAPVFDTIPDEFRPGVSLGATGTIDVAGRWTNNYLESLNGEALTNAVVDGGDVTLQGYSIKLAEGSLIDVSGGAALGTDGRTLTLGDGGSVTLDVDTALSIGLQPGGELVTDGKLLGHAPGKGGTLNIYTPWELIVADDWGDLAVIADGKLEAGTAAPKDVVLTEALTLPAGTVLDFDLAVAVRQLTGGEPLLSGATLTGVTNTAPVTVLVDWVVPTGVTVRATTTSTNQVYTEGMTVPAGTLLRAFGTGTANGTLPAGFVMPTGVFRTSDGFDGLRLGGAGAQVQLSAGATLAVDTALPVGHIFAKGTVLAQDAVVNNDFRLVSPNLFEAGSHAPAADAWGDLTAIADGRLEAGIAAPGQVRLVAPVVIPAGDALPVDASYQIDRLPLDEPLPASFGVNYLNYAKPLTLEAEWTVPAGVGTVRTSVLVNGVYQSSGQAFGPGSRLPAGTKIGFVSGTLPAGAVVSSAVLPNGLPLSAPVTIQAAKGDVIGYNATIAAGTTLEAGTVLANEARVAFAGQLGQGRDFQDGFANFALTGAQGMTITSGTVIAPTHDTLQLDGTLRDVATGARLAEMASVAGSGVTLVRSTDLPEWQRQATDLVLGSRPADFAGTERRSGWAPFTTQAYSAATTVKMEQGAEIRMTAESRVMLNSARNLFVDGLIEAKGGEIVLQESGPSQSGNAVSVVVGDHARLLAGGYQAIVGQLNGQDVRAVAAGGSIRIGHDTTSVNGQHLVLVGDGALLDVSGVAGITDLPAGAGGDGLDRASFPLVAMATDGAGGDITINAHRGLIAGELRLGAGGETGLGGHLAFNAGGSGNFLVRDAITDIDPTTANSLVPADRLTLSAERISASGADDLSLGNVTPFTRDASQVAFDGDVRLSARRSIVIEAERLYALPSTAEDAQPTNVTIESAYVRLSGAGDGTRFEATTAAEANSLTVRAGLIDLMGVLVLDNAAATGGFATADFVSAGDIRLVSQRDSGLGGLGSSGAIRFTSAQTYVTPGNSHISAFVEEGMQFEVGENDPGYLVSSPISVEVRSNGAAAPVPLSWGGKLTLRAPEIVQAGVLRAPLGTIALDAVDTVDAEGNTVVGRLTLAPDSLTSVSLEGSIALAGLVTSTEKILGYARDDWSPSKAVVLSGGDVDLQDGAVVDLSGGGDLLGYSFASGTTGVTNILNDGSADAAFAILPGYDGPTAAPVGARPLGGEAGWLASNPGNNVSGINSGTSDARLRVGDQVYLTGVPGLADGYYTLLPAAFALQKGGMLVKPVQGGLSGGPQAIQRRDDGSVVASGYRAVAGTEIRPDQGWTSFQVMDGDTWRQYSTITTYSFNEQRAATNAETGLGIRTPHDAGRLVIEASNSLKLLGEARLSGSGSGDSAGLAGDVDISNPGGGIALVGAGQAAPEGYLAVDAGTVQAFAGAGSLLLGGRRPITTWVVGSDNAIDNLGAIPDGLTVSTTASDVLIADGVRYSGLELLLAASDTISIGADARLTAAGSGRTNDTTLLTFGNGALFRLSAGERAGLVRTGGTDASGVIAIGSGAVLESAGALLLDASAGFDLSPDAVLDVGQLDLASDRINIGDTPDGVSGTVIALETIERLAGASDLLLRAHQALAVWGDFALGGRGTDGKATLGSLTFDTPVIEGHAGAGEGLTLTAGTLTLRNSGGTAQAAAGTGALTLDVDQLVLGDGDLGIAGYTGVGGRIGQLRAEGVGSLSIAGDANLAVGHVAAATGARYGLEASGALALRQGQASATLTDGLGGSLNFAGASVLLDTNVVSQAGSIAFEATGGDLELGANARIDVSGVAKDYVDAVRYAPGGVVKLIATGDVVTDEASRIDVSGHERGGAAGVVDVTAGGAARLDGVLLAETAQGEAGGDFALDAGEADFAALNARLNAGRFTNSRDIRLDQAITLAAGERIEAHEVSLRSDGGDVRIAGTIAASGDAANASGGAVRLTGANVLLEATGRIDAAAANVDAADFQPASGSVMLAADEGRVALAAGSVIDLSGGREGGGRLTVRAARTATGADAELGATVTGAREKILVGSRVYEAATVNTALTTTMLNDANAWLAGASAPAGWQKGAGIVIRSDGDLTVANNIDLSTISGPGYLGLEADGNLVINANISDGFSSAAADATLGTDASFSYGLEAGDDLRLGEMAPALTAPFVAPGTAFPSALSMLEVVPFTVAANWVVPTGMRVRTSAGIFNTGQTVPAGTTVTGQFNTTTGTFPAGYVLPVDAFPQGLSFAPRKPAFTGQGRIVRTGTGDIDVRAGRDLMIGGESVIYTAGRATDAAAGFDRSPYVRRKVANTDLVLGDFPTQGGNLRLAAGRDITMSPIEQTPTAWLFRYGNSTWNGDPNEALVAQQTSWSIVYRNYQSGVGALGGGNVAVRATGDITDLSVALPTTGHMTAAVGSRARADDIVVRGGGDLTVRALGDIGGGSFVLGKGRAELIAGGAVTGGAAQRVVVAGEQLLQNNGGVFETRGMAPLFGLMDATVSVQAGRGVEIEGAYDLGLVPQICENISGSCTGQGIGSAWVALSDRAALDAVAAGGDMIYRANSTAAATLTRENRNAGFRVWLSAPIPPQINAPTSFIPLFNRAPGTVRMATMSGDLRVEGGMTLSAATRGTLELLAAGDIALAYSEKLELEDRNPAYIRNGLTPVTTEAQATARLFTLNSDAFATIANNYYRGYDLLHADDLEPVRIYALDGSIGLYNGSIYDPWMLLSPKAARIQAGGNIGIADLSITHNRATDLTTVIAGGDIQGRGSRTGGGYRIYGQGDLWVEAGGSLAFDLGPGVIISGGNGQAAPQDLLLVGLGGTRYQTNHALADVGADIRVVAGTAQGSDYAAFADLYLDPANLADPTFGLSHPTNEGKVVRTYEEELEAFLEGRGFTGVTGENRRTLFDGLPQQTRGAFLQQVLAEELRQTGIDYNDADGARFQQYTRGYNALHLLYPGTEGLDRDNPLGGDILLNNGTIESISGGSIDLIAPYGRVGIGDPADPRVRADAGILTRRGGDIAILANGTISLDQSRVFTLQGGDLMMWTSNGDITAGVGAKTNVSSVPLSFLLDRDGLLSVNVFGLQTGAGIGVLDAFEGRDPDRKPSRLDLLAFFGEVNAGDAGIRVVGDINIAALRVVNAANIQVTGEAVGIPQVAAVNLGALSAASSATAAVVSEATQLAQRSRPRIQTDMPTILSVRFLGFGE